MSFSSCCLRARDVSLCLCVFVSFCSCGPRAQDAPSFRPFCIAADLLILRQEDELEKCRFILSAQFPHITLQSSSHKKWVMDPISGDYFNSCTALLLCCAAPSLCKTGVQGFTNLFKVLPSSRASSQGKMTRHVNALCLECR